MLESKVSTRTIGIDYGMARIGLAISDERKIIASPLATLKAEKKSANTLTKFLELVENHQKENRYTIDEIVIGLPLKMSGEMGLLADEVKHFVELLRKHVNVPIITWDERLSTVQADRSLREANLSRKRRAKVIDEVTAVIILQSYLDLKSLQREAP